MDLPKILEALRVERANVYDAIMTLEQLALHGKPRRGRPPAWRREIMSLAGAKSGNGKGSLNGSASSAGTEKYAARREP
jgi:hypothetical protein